MFELWAYVDGRKMFVGRMNNEVIAQTRADSIAEHYPGMEVILVNQQGQEVYTSGILNRQIH